MPFFELAVLPRELINRFAEAIVGCRMSDVGGMFPTFGCSTVLLVESGNYGA